MCFQEDPKERDDSRTANKDGLLYSTIKFNQEQMKKSEAIPPERETTDYASIVFGKQGPAQND